MNRREVIAGGGVCSCREVMTAYLGRIDRINPGHLAIVMLRDPEVLFAEADAADASLRAHGLRGPLHGFPLAPKDSTLTAGLPSRMGSRVSDPRPAASDGIIAQRMRRAGGIFIGKTNMPELGLGSQSYNTIFGTTLNAWNQKLTAGGSSGGAAVAVAQRLVPPADAGGWADDGHLSPVEGGSRAWNAHRTADRRRACRVRKRSPRDGAPDCRSAASRPCSLADRQIL